MIVRNLILGQRLYGRKLVDELRLHGQLQDTLQHLVQLCRAQWILFRRLETLGIVVRKIWRVQNPWVSASSGASSLSICALFNSSSMRVRNNTWHRDYVIPSFWRLWYQSLDCCKRKGITLSLPHWKKIMNDRSIAMALNWSSWRRNKRASIMVNSRSPVESEELEDLLERGGPGLRSNNVHSGSFAKVLPTNGHQILEILIVGLHVFGHTGWSMEDPNKCFGSMCVQCKKGYE